MLSYPSIRFLIRCTISCVVLLSFSFAMYAIFSSVSFSVLITNCGLLLAMLLISFFFVDKVLAK